MREHKAKRYEDNHLSCDRQKQRCLRLTEGDVYILSTMLYKNIISCAATAGSIKRKISGSIASLSSCLVISLFFSFVMSFILFVKQINQQSVPIYYMSAPHAPNGAMDSADT